MTPTRVATSAEAALYEALPGPWASAEPPNGLLGTRTVFSSGKQPDRAKAIGSPQAQKRRSMAHLDSCVFLPVQGTAADPLTAQGHLGFQARGREDKACAVACLDQFCSSLEAVQIDGRSVVA